MSNTNDIRFRCSQTKISIKPRGRNVTVPAHTSTIINKSYQGRLHTQNINQLK